MKRSTKIRIRHRGAPTLFYPAALPLSSQTLNYTAGIIRRHRRQIGSCWRKLNPGRQALLVLADKGAGGRLARRGAGPGGSARSTAASADVAETAAKRRMSTAPE
jgi:hypothetical protein